VRPVPVGLAIVGIVLAGWGIALIVKVATGGTPDASPGALVGVGAVLLVLGLALLAAAALAAGRRRR
jgi:hypothetical protein